MEKTNGEIQYIKVTKEGEKFSKKWKLYTVKINDIFYSGFGNEDRDPYSKFSQGDHISLEYEINGEYNNIKSISLYNKEAEELYEKYVNKNMLDNPPKEKVDNTLNKEMNDSVEKMISVGIFIGDFNINGDTYEISIKKK